MSPEKVETRRYSGRCVPNVDLQIAVWKRPAAVRDFAVSDTRSSSIPSVSPCPRLRGDRAPTRNGCDKPPQHWSPSHVRGYRRRDDEAERLRIVGYPTTACRATRPRSPTCATGRCVITATASASGG